jgi:dTMP kinase
VVGRFIVFEGIDASGKSTQARHLAQQCQGLFTFEPGDTALGGELRRWLLDAATPMTPETEALLMLADRSHHVATVIAPTLASGRHVIADRFSASTLAYQGFGRGVDREKLRVATELAIGDCRPDLTLLIDIDIETANERRARNHEDRFESGDAAFHERLRQGYLAMAATEERWCVIDGRGTFDDVSAAITAAVAPLW